MRAITVLSVAYVLTIALIMIWLPGSASKAQSVLFGEALFGAPMIIANVLAKWLDKVEARRVLFVFGVGFVVFALATIYSTFSGEPEAQYQLLLLLIPAVGFPSVAVAGAIAAWLGRAQ